MAQTITKARLINNKIADLEKKIADDLNIISQKQQNVIYYKRLLNNWGIKLSVLLKKKHFLAKPEKKFG